MTTNRNHEMERERWRQTHSLNRFQQHVQAFHQAFGHPAPAFPYEELTPKLKEQLLARAEWLHEEAEELVEAIKAGDMVGVLDALGDSAYFAVGGYVVLGHNMNDFWENIQDANMAKLDPETGEPIIRESDGKVMKPEGWVAPEARHEVTLANAVRAAKTESAARQLAYMQVTEPDEPISMRGSWSPSELQRILERSQQIAANPDVARALYAELEEYVETLA